MNHRLMKLSGLAAASGAIILLACGMDSEPPLMPLPFALALVVQLVCATVLLRRGLWQHGGLVLAVCVILLALSFLPVYVQHYVPWKGGSYHRHTIWDLGHVH